LIISQLQGNTQQLVLPPSNTVKFGLQSLSFAGSLIWDRLPKNVKSFASLNIFKNRFLREKDQLTIITNVFVHFFLKTIKL